MGFVILTLIAGGCSSSNKQNPADSFLDIFKGKSKDEEAAQKFSTLQADTMREADQYTAMVAQASDEFATKMDTPTARFAAQQWKLQQGTAAYINGAGENPAMNAVDMVILATVSRMVVSDYWVGEAFGSAAEPLLHTHEQLEANAWSTANLALTVDQQQQLKEAITAWRAKNPNQRNVGAARFNDFVNLLGPDAAVNQNQGPTSLFSLALVNPLAGLDPTVRAIEESRELAARIMYYAERAPRLWAWQIELMSFRLADEPESRKAFADIDRVADSTQSFAKTAEGLPALVNEQREAAINQLLAGIAVERAKLVDTLNDQESRLNTLLPQMQQTLNAGDNMAKSVDHAVTSLDAFVKTVSPPETQPAAPSTSPPFNVLDYGTAASQVGAAAKDLDTLLTSLDRSVPQVSKLGQQGTADAERLLHRAFWLGMILIATFFGCALLSGIIWRFLIPARRKAA